MYFTPDLSPDRKDCTHDELPLKVNDFLKIRKKFDSCHNTLFKPIVESEAREK